MRRFGLIGKTLTHSFSKPFFEKKFREEGLRDCSYENFELESSDEVPSVLRQPDIAGLNVTIPYKEQVLSYLDEQNEIVKETGACNCIRRFEDRFFGYNTDVPAFVASLKTMLQAHHKCALILGTGGASKAVQYGLRQLGLEYLVVSRHKKDDEIGYEDVGEEQMAGHQIIINTTPLGMYPNVNADPSIPYEFIGKQHLLYDLIYNPPKTRFLQQGEEKGAAILNGYDMLVAQAEESWKIWNQSTP